MMEKGPMYVEEEMRDTTKEWANPNIQHAEEKVRGKGKMTIAGSNGTLH